MSLGLRYGYRYGLRYGEGGAAPPTPDPTGPAGTLLPWPVEAFTWGLTWRTDILAMRDGSEYRQALNDYPRESFDVEFVLDTADARYMREILKANAARVFHLPVRILDVLATAAVTSTTVTADVSLADWAVVGQRVMLEDDAGNTHATHLATVSVGSVTIADAVAATFPAGSRLVPLACVYLDDKATAGHYAVNAGRWSARARAFLPLTVLGGGGTAPATYASHDLLEEAPDMDDATASEAIDGGIDLIDAGGAIAVTTAYTVANVQRSGSFTAQSEAERQTWLRFLVARNGRQVTFWHATHRADFDVTASGSGTLTVSNPSAYGSAYVATWAAALVGTHIAVKISGAATRYLQIAAATVGASTTVLDVTGASPNLTGLTITMVCRLELVRLADDTVMLEDRGAGLLGFDLPTIVVPQ